MSVIIDGTSGITTPAETVQGALTTTGNTILGDASTDTLTVGVTGIVKDASGNVGIGTASPTAKFHVYAAASTDAKTIVGALTATNSAYTAFVNTTVTTVGTENSTGGNLVIGSSAYSTVLANNGAYPISFGTNNTERMRIDSSGNLLVGTTNTSATAGAGMKFVISADPSNPPIRNVLADASGAIATYTLYSTNAAAYRFFVTTAGAVNATSITITAISDQRLKENVRDIDRGLDAIMALKPRRFDWKEGKGQDKKDVAGFIAQEFEAVFPECVGTSIAGADGIEYKNINHETLIPTLVKAIQELKAIVDAQAVRIAALEL